MTQDLRLTTASGIPVADNQNSISAGPRGPLLLQDFHLIEKLQHFNRERIPERVVHAKGSGAYGTFTVTHDISHLTKARLFSEIGKKTETFVRFSTVGGEDGFITAAFVRRHCASNSFLNPGSSEWYPTGAKRSKKSPADQ